MNARDGFLQNVRRALGRDQRALTVVPAGETSLSRDAQSVERRAQTIIERATADADGLFSQLRESAAQACWKVARLASADEAARYVVGLARDLEARSIIRSAHSVLDQLHLEALLAGSGLDVGVMAIDEVSSKGV